MERNLREKKRSNQRNGNQSKQFKGKRVMKEREGSNQSNEGEVLKKRTSGERERERELD